MTSPMHSNMFSGGLDGTHKGGGNGMGIRNGFHGSRWPFIGLVFGPSFSESIDLYVFVLLISFQCHRFICLETKDEWVWQVRN